MLIDRLTERAQRLAMTQAISQLNGVDRRLLALFWHLGERWGRVVRDGVAVPRRRCRTGVIAQLVGARRPTVSTALGTLAERGELVRREDGGWLLTGEPVGVPTRRGGADHPLAPAPLPGRRDGRGAGADVATAQLAATGRIAELHDGARRACKADSGRQRDELRGPARGDARAAGADLGAPRAPAAPARLRENG